MFCKNCGQQIPDQDGYCPNCGTHNTVNDARSFSQQAKNAANDAFESTNQGLNNAFDDVKQTFQGTRPSGGPLRTDRSLAVYIILSIITLGLYSYYFIYRIAQDMNEACKGDGETTGGLATFIILSFVTCGFYSLYWEYKLGNRLANNAPRYGLSFQENGTTVLLWYLVGMFVCGIGPFVAMYIIIKNCNLLFGGYNRAMNF